MKRFKKFFFKNKSDYKNKKILHISNEQLSEIGRIVREARTQKNISIEQLSLTSKIPCHIIDSIENNIENVRPKNPFLRSILFKLEECLSLQRNILTGLLVKETNSKEIDKKEFLLNKLDLINTWEGSILYFLLLILIIFIVNRYFVSNINIIEIQNIEEKIKDK